MVLTRDGTALYSKCWGWGRPVVLVHGWPLSADSWDPIATILANAGFRVISYDRRGFAVRINPRMAMTMTRSRTIWPR
jgi:pimeloyl-ACP methyl ester carboxylesterase